MEEVLEAKFTGILRISGNAFQHLQPKKMKIFTHLFHHASMLQVMHLMIPLWS